MEAPAHRPVSRGPAHVQIAALMLRFRTIGDVVIASSTLSVRPAPPALGTLRRHPCGGLRRTAVTSLIDPHLAVR
jgi:hypothetical protein